MNDASGTPPATPDPAPDPAPVPPEPPAEFNVAFAVIAGILLVGVVIALIWVLRLFQVHVGLSADEWKALDPKSQFAARIAVPITVLGLVAVLLGIWMAVTEWRGRFKSVPKTKSDDQPHALDAPAIDPGKVIEAVGKLRGAALVMIVGAILMVSAAWIASSAAGSSNAPASTTDTTQPPKGAEGK